MAPTNEQESSGLDVDEILEKGGPCGVFQIGLQGFFLFFVLCVGYEVLITYFTGYNPSWTCVNNSSSMFCTQHYGRRIEPHDPFFNEKCKLQRSEWNFTTPKDQSFVAEFDLVCDKQFYAAFATGAFFIGAAIGSMCSGIIADKYGRRMVLIVTLSFSVLLSILTSFVQSAWQLIAIRTLLGAMHLSCYGIAFIFLSEMIAPSYRTSSSNIYNLTYSISHLILTLVAYYERRWRRLQLYTAFPTFIPLFIFFFLPKSPRWLAASDRIPEAENVLKKICIINGKPTMSISLKRSTICNDRIYTYFDLFRHSKIAIATCVTAYLWLAIGLIYFTVTLESSNLGGNIYKSYALSTVSDVPSNFAAIYLCYRFGRKKATLGSILSSVVFVGCVAAVPNSVENSHVSAFGIRIGLAMVGRFFAHCACNGISLWTFELFPTVIRTQGWMICMVVFRSSGVAAPFVTSVLHSISVYLPYGLVSLIGLFACCIGVLLPETNNLPTREKYEDMFASSEIVVEELCDMPGAVCNTVAITSDE